MDANPYKAGGDAERREPLTEAERRLGRSWIFWFVQGRLTTALVMGAISAVVVYHMTGWLLVSGSIAFLLSVGVLALMAMYAPK